MSSLGTVDSAMPRPMRAGRIVDAAWIPADHLLRARQLSLTLSCSCPAEYWKQPGVLQFNWKVRSSQGLNPGRRSSASLVSRGPVPPQHGHIAFDWHRANKRMKLTRRM
jgi:hypothetical protein